MEFSSDILLCVYIACAHLGSYFNAHFVEGCRKLSMLFSPSLLHCHHDGVTLGTAHHHAVLSRQRI